MNPLDQIEVIEEQVTDVEQQQIELRLADLDLVGGGSAGMTFF